MLHELVEGRKLETPVREIEMDVLLQIERILEQGDHDQAERKLWANVVLGLRELADLRNRLENIFSSGALEAMVRWKNGDMIRADERIKRE